MAIWDIKEIYNLQRSNGWAFKGDRCVFGAGSDSNVIDFMSAAAGGTAADFGDLTAARGHMQDNYGTHTRGIFAGGANLNTIDFVTIATTGNAGPAKGDSNADLGTVCIAIATPNQVYAQSFSFGKERYRVLIKSLNMALTLLQKEIFKN